MRHLSHKIYKDLAINALYKTINRQKIPLSGIVKGNKARTNIACLILLGEDSFINNVDKLKDYTRDKYKLLISKAIA